MTLKNDSGKQQNDTERLKLLILDATKQSYEGPRHHQETTMCFNQPKSNFE